MIELIDFDILVNLTFKLISQPFDVKWISHAVLQASKQSQWQVSGDVVQIELRNCSGSVMRNVFFIIAIVKLFEVARINYLTIVDQLFEES